MTKYGYKAMTSLNVKLLDSIRIFGCTPLRALAGSGSVAGHLERLFVLKHLNQNVG